METNDSYPTDDYPSSLPPTPSPSGISDSDAEANDSWGLFVLFFALFLSILVTFLLLRTRFRFLPESIAVIGIGLIMGSIILAVNNEVNPILALSSESFFLILLPPIIFESGYNLHKGNFFKNFTTIMIFAVIGTIISTIVVGGGIFLFGMIPGIPYQLPFLECLICGALISAVDPVATLAIFSALDVDPTLHTLVFGESVLNDAVAVVIYRTLVNFLKAEFDSSMIGMAFLQFFINFFGSVLIGITFALLSALLLKFVDFRRYFTLEISVVIIFAYAPYLVSEAIGLSGIMAILFCGIVMSHYTYFNLSPVSQITTEKVFRSLSFLAETSVFAYLGLAIPNFAHVFNITLISVTLFLILVGRALNVFPLSFITNFFRRVKITRTMQFLMFFSGLRGAIAFSLALNLKNLTSSYQTILTTTLSIVIFTIVIFGGGTFPLIKFMEKFTKSSILVKKVDMVGTRDKQLEEEEKFTEPQGWFENFDNKYLIKFFRKKQTLEAYRVAYRELRDLAKSWPVIPDDRFLASLDNESAEELIIDDRPEEEEMSDPTGRNGKSRNNGNSSQSKTKRRRASQGEEQVSLLRLESEDPTKDTHLIHDDENPFSAVDLENP